MSSREKIVKFLLEQIDIRADADAIAPSTLAIAALRHFAGDRLPPEIEYVSLEQLKAMARSTLAGRFGTQKDARVPAEQSELFTDLQDRYPVPREKGAEPIYVLRSALTAYQRAWNVDQLRKTGRAYLAHADKLEAEGRQQERDTA